MIPPCAMDGAGCLPHGGPGELLRTLSAMNPNYLIGLLCFVFWIVALLDCIKGGGPNQLLWILVIILLPFLGTVLYFLFGRARV